MKLPIPPGSPELQVRQSDGGGGGGGDCMGGGAVAGIAIGSVAGAFLIYFLIKFAYESRYGGEVVPPRESRPRRRRRRRYDDEPSVSRRRKYRRDVELERPSKVYVNGH